MPSSNDSFAETLASCVTIDDFEEAARARLPPMAFDYYRSGADEDSPRPRGRTSPPPPRSDLAVLAET